MKQLLHRVQSGETTVSSRHQRLPAAVPGPRGGGRSLDRRARSGFGSDDRGAPPPPPRCRTSPAGRADPGV